MTEHSVLTEQYADKREGMLPPSTAVAALPISSHGAMCPMALTAFPRSLLKTKLELAPEVIESEALAGVGGRGWSTKGLKEQ